MEITELMLRAHKTATEKGWWKNFEALTEQQKTENIASKLLMMHCEVSEAAEELRDPKEGFDITDIYYMEPGGDISRDSTSEWFYGTNPDVPVIRLNKPEGLIVELADVVIRILDLSAQLKLPLNTAIEQKLAYNETRSYRHGNKSI